MLSVSDKNFYTIFKHLLPPGVYYEAAKNRWRVRLYKEGTVVFRAYFKSFDAAYEALIKAKDIQANATNTKIEYMTIDTTHTAGLISSMGVLN